MAQISDCCNQPTAKNSCSTSFIISIDTDKLPIQSNQQFSALVQQYISTIATIQKKKEFTMPSSSSSLYEHTAFLKILVSMYQISSMWEIDLVHDGWRDMITSEIYNQSGVINNNKNMNYHSTALYAIVWSNYDGMNGAINDHDNDQDEDDDNYDCMSCVDEDDQFDEDAKEILWVVHSN